MTNNKSDTNNNDNKSSNTSMPAENRERHKPAKGLPRV